MSFFQLLALPILLALFLLPTILAVKKNHPHKLPIILVNIFGGLVMGAGWLVALVWVLIKPTAAVQQPVAVAGTNHHIADELTKLKKLVDDGVLSEEDFAQRKKLLLAAGTAS